MKHNPFKNLTKNEWILYILSLVITGVSGFIAGGAGLLSTFSSMLGVTALIFVAKGDVYGQLFSIFFGLLYGIVSFKFRYYGEVITYVGMTVPSAFVTLISWLKHPYKDSDEVEVSHLTVKKGIGVLLISSAVTVAFYFILGALDTPNLIVSTVSIFTSCAASVLLIMRLPHYALAYSANDIVLIILWVLASIKSIEYLPMVLCFTMFLANDLYGFFNWRKMKRNQAAD